MPAPRLSRRTQEHIEEARANYRRYERMLGEPEDISWATVFLFYSALHLVQAFARHYTPDDISKDHEDRAGYIAFMMPTEVAENYARLERVSKQARYSLATFTAVEVKSLHDDFARIRKYMREQNIAWQSPTGPQST